MAESPSSSPEKGGPSTTATPEKGDKMTSVRKRYRVFWLGGALALIILALALGLGLGLGLRSRNSTSSSAAVSPSPSSTSTPVPTGTPLPGAGANAKLEDWRLDTSSQYVLDMNWDLNAAPTTRHYDLVISEGQGWPDGVVRDMLFINGKFPGPLIEANMGDRLVVNVTNKLSKNATTIHWHGLYQNGTNWYDGTTGITQCGIPAGTSFVYNFTLTQFGTYWYHSHYGTQYSDGIFGPLIIHGTAGESDARKLYDRDQIVLVQDWYHDFSTALLVAYLAPDNENTEPIPDNGLINGQAWFNCSSYSADSGYTCYDNNTYTVLTLPADTRTRLRLINTGSFTEFEFSVDNHSLSVIEADSTLVQPHMVHRLPIHVAQRYSVVLNTNQSTGSNYWMRAEMVTFCFTGDNPVLDATTKAVISYSGNDSIVPSESLSKDWGDATIEICQDLDPSLLVPVEQKIPPAATTMWRIDFSFGIGGNQLDRAKVNGTSWTPLMNTTTLMEVNKGVSTGNASLWEVDGQVTEPWGTDQFVVGVGGREVDVVDVLLYSLDEGSHPFHFHGHQFWILETGSGPFDWTSYHENIYTSKSTAVQNVLRRDTLTVEPYGWALIRFVADNPGLWAFHCHITWHMEAGLMAQFVSRAYVLGGTELPADVTALCAAQ